MHMNKRDGSKQEDTPAVEASICFICKIYQLKFICQATKIVNACNLFVIFVSKPGRLVKDQKGSSYARNLEVSTIKGNVNSCYLEVAFDLSSGNIKMKSLQLRHCVLFLAQNEYLRFKKMFMKCQKMDFTQTPLKTQNRISACAFAKS